MLNSVSISNKINNGDEPISNTIWGIDGNYQTEAPWLTKAVDWLPLIETKAKSRLIATAEFACVCCSFPTLLFPEIIIL